MTSENLVAIFDRLAQGLADRIPEALGAALGPRFALADPAQFSEIWLGPADSPVDSWTFRWPRPGARFSALLTAKTSGSGIVGADPAPALAPFPSADINMISMAPDGGPDVSVTRTSCHALPRARLRLGWATRAPARAVALALQPEFSAQ